MSREARKTAQIWASIEKMQKKEEESNLSDNSSDKAVKRKKKKLKKMDGEDDDDGELTMHKSSEFKAFVPPRKKWVSRWENNHPKVDVLAQQVPQENGTTSASSLVSPIVEKKPAPQLETPLENAPSTQEEEGLITTEPSPQEPAVVAPVSEPSHSVSQETTEEVPPVVQEPEPAPSSASDTSEPVSAPAPRQTESPPRMEAPPQEEIRMNVLGSRRKRKSLWDVGDPRLDDTNNSRNPHRRDYRSASADNRNHNSSNRAFHSSSFQHGGSGQYNNSRRYQPFLKPREPPPPPRSSSSSWGSR
ncbi:hypothetical protein LEN26_004301 [Aphanomyces euteiches]|nr:hypothetical protein AeMF1_002860 [Aphanomyces euteiches]KAH9130309.1 hypothetical protein LEN26_008655 [Aphanomyces euteiches]KAH9146012.1 hypothetical protein LEN26_004970 [Aphanomyces euteiches]KAH9149271.1 hypothetical protein LEN26_004301 [Aphanomyces euteiches]KAH9189943.1 hypothetical protein AeNC1_008084 [Aphanomyces euteiches]